MTTYWCNANFVKEEYHKQGISKALMNLAVHKVTCYSLALDPDVRFDHGDLYRRRRTGGHR